VAKKFRVLVLLTLGLSGCMRALPPTAFQDSTPEMRPERFFDGTTRSTGVVENRAGAPTRRFAVTGSGQMLPDGSFRLEQSILFEGGKRQTRTWTLRRVDDHHYVGTLTDASGPVKAEAYGNLFHLRYPMKSPFGGEMEQWLYLQPDGRTVLNEATVRVFGFVAAHVSERITHEGP
jgi:hypothetical protein